MRKRILLCVAVGGALVAAAQTRTETYDAAAATVQTVRLSALADGGCEAFACGTVPGDTGAVTRECTSFEFKAGGLNQSRCLALFDAAKPRVLRAMRFDVDGGAP